MRTIDLLASAIVLTGALYIATPASATYNPPPDDLFKMCCEEAGAQRCCHFNGCQITSSGCKALKKV